MVFFNYFISTWIAISFNALLKALLIWSGDKGALFLKVVSGISLHPALYINEPVTKQGRTPFLVKMFDTHPPLDERIARLKRLLGEN